MICKAPKGLGIKIISDDRASISFAIVTTTTLVISFCPV